MNPVARVLREVTVTVFRDITERKQAQEEIDRHAKANFVRLHLGCEGCTIIISIEDGIDFDIKSRPGKGALLCLKIPNDRGEDHASDSSTSR